MPMDTITDLSSRLTAARERVSALAAQRQPYAFAAKTGDADAQAKLDALSVEQRSADIEVGDLELAVVEAERLAEKAREEAAAKQAAARLAKARKLATAFLDESAKVDNAARDMAAALTRRAELRLELAATGTLSNDGLNRLNNPRAVNRALHVLGVGKFCDLPLASAITHGKPLSEADETTLSSLRAAGPQHTDEAA